MIGHGSDPRDQLKEAIREIQVMAGLTDATASRLRISRAARFDEGPAVLSQAFGNRAFKTVRGSAAPDALSAPRSLTIGVTSVNYRDGKSTVAMALASCLAHDFAAEVTLADADFETHSIGREYGLIGRQGLAEVLTGETSLVHATFRYRAAPLSVVTSGEVKVEPSRLARSESLKWTIEEMKGRSAFVVLDLPAALHSTNAAVIGAHCDGVIVVVRAGHTTRQELDRVLRQFHSVNVIGVVLNRQASSVPGWVDRLLALPA
ncbi:MAG: CpsD/CapB family tyrosine-protein kinase [Dehalococcoidia bacterium]